MNILYTNEFCIVDNTINTVIVWKMERFLERLPDKNCPPEYEAHQVKEEMYVFRLVKTNPPTVKDFRAASNNQPLKENAESCRDKAISVFYGNDGLKKCKGLRLLPSHKGELLCKVVLNKNAGYVRTIKLPHIDWWLYKDFKVLEFCEMMNENE